MAILEHIAEGKPIKIFRVIKNSIFAVILVALVGVIALTMFTRISGKTPSLFGYTVYRVSSGSMEPTFKVGEIIICKDCDPMQLKNGDIITYDGTSGDFAGKSVTHRVVKPPYKEGNGYYLVTKGDDNPVEDTPISVEQVTGIFLNKIEFLKMLFDFFVTPWGLITLVALIILAFFNEIVIFVSALTGRGTPPKKKEDIHDIIARLQNNQELLAESEHAELIDDLTEPLGVAITEDEKQMLENDKNRDNKE